jgi:nucleotide-binding universal stress UspA family protein
VLLVSAYEEPLPRHPESGNSVPGPRAEAESVLTSCAALATEAAPEITVTTRLVHGWPDSVLAEVAYGAELLVIGSRGLGRLSVALRGSVGVELAATSMAPLVVVRGPDPASLPESGELSVVVGVDGSVASLAAARFAAEEAELGGEPLVVVHVEADPRGAEATEQILASVRSAHPGLRISYRQAAGQVATALADISADARLLVVGTRGRGGFAGLVLGSVTQSLMRRAQCPLGIISPRMASAEHSEAAPPEALSQTA